VFDPNGVLLAQASNFEIWLLKMATGEVVGNIRSKSPVRSAAFSPDGQSIAWGDSVGTIHIFDVKTQEEKTHCKAHAEDIYSLAYTSDGGTLVSGSGDQTVKVWKMPKGELRFTLHGHRAEVGHVVVSPDRRTAATGGWNGQLCIWDLRNGKGRHVLQADPDRVFSLCFSPDGKYVVTGGRDIRIWDVGTGKCYMEWNGHGGDRPTATFLGSTWFLSSQGNRRYVMKCWDLSSLAGR
jgi:WD40 repeat protein